MRRLNRRRGHKKALGAVKHSIISSASTSSTPASSTTELGSDYFTQRDPERITKRLIAQLERLGHKVILQTSTSTSTTEAVVAAPA